MSSSNTKSIALFILCASAVYCNSDLSYNDLETLGVSCPSKDKCSGYRNNLSYMERSCECDNLCTSYGDCCIDARARTGNSTRTNNSSARRRTSSVRSDIKCLHYGLGTHTGVYVINKCSNSWTGPRQVREKCVGPVDYSDPLKAAPVTSIEQSATYRNMYCAECNNANMQFLSTFQMRMVCEGLQELTEDQILADMTYNNRTDHWGVNRLNNHGNATNFYECDIIFDVPGYLNNSVRFCRSNLISTCARDWNRPVIKRNCGEYMAVVYENSNIAYKNPHCALCNHKTVDDISCRTEVISRKRPMSFALLLDVNQSDGDQVGMRRVATPSCPSGHKYDPFFKKCRELVCALPGHVVVDGRCVRG